MKAATVTLHEDTAYIASIALDPQQQTIAFRFRPAQVEVDRVHAAMERFDQALALFGAAGCIWTSDADQNGGSLYVPDTLPFEKNAAVILKNMQDAWVIDAKSVAAVRRACEIKAIGFQRGQYD